MCRPFQQKSMDTFSPQGLGAQLLREESKCYKILGWQDINYWSERSDFVYVLNGCVVSGNGWLEGMGWTWMVSRGWLDRGPDHCYRWEADHNLRLGEVGKNLM